MATATRQRHKARPQANGQGNKDLRLELTRKINDLAADLVTDPDKLRQFARMWTNGFHSYSWGNLLLIMSAKPDATLCAGYRAWLEHHRYVCKGQRGIPILAPIYINKTDYRQNDETGTLEEVKEKVLRFRVVYVFDYSQTDGEPLDNLAAADLVQGDGGLKLQHVIDRIGYPVKITTPDIKAGQTDGRTITIAQTSEPAMIATLLHEATHAMLGHVNDPERDTTTKELEAEATGHIACAVLGIDEGRSAYYLGYWGGTRDALQKSAPHILKTAEAICRRLTDQSEGRPHAHK